MFMENVFEDDEVEVELNRQRSVLVCDDPLMPATRCC